ncbi:rac GTPase-activating protein 1-like [Mobula hypostoma]|uniref:rac GTPase-activating protein 1-like n=1 Tax=Mobula hypostoma TaxID=723540 RepID=UPI002FC2858F
MMRFREMLERELDAVLRVAECVPQQTEQAFYQLALSFERCRKKWKAAEEELAASRNLLAEVQLEKTSLEIHLKHARHQLDIELKRRQKAELACEQLERRLQLVHDMLSSEGPALGLQAEDQENILNVLNSHSGATRSRIPTVEETLLSNLSHSGISYDRTSDEMLVPATTGRVTRPKNRDRRCSARILVDGVPLSARRSRSSSELFLDPAGSPSVTQPTDRSQSPNHPRSPHPVASRRRRSLVPELADGGVRNQQTPQTTPAPPAGILFSPGGLSGPENKAPSRPHNFVSKTIIRPESCLPCGKRIRFGKVVLKCRSCCLVSHPDCCRLCPTLCAPNFTLTLVKNGEGTVADFAPPTAPMIPSLVIHCISEIERRGLKEPGIYRIPGCERTVRELRERYVRGKGLPVLSRVTNIHVICSLLKYFLHKLKEPVLTFGLQPMFLAATDLSAEHSQAELCRALATLPRANRETLAYLVTHLHRVISSPACRMDQRNLARVFGPTLVGHAKPDPHPREVFEDMKRQPEVVERLLSLPPEVWGQVVSKAPTGSGASKPSPFVYGTLFKPLTSPDAAKMDLSPGCCLPPGLLTGTSYKLFPSPTPK